MFSFPAPLSLLKKDPNVDWSNFWQGAPFAGGNVKDEALGRLRSSLCTRPLLRFGLDWAFALLALGLLWELFLRFRLPLESPSSE